MSDDDGTGSVRPSSPQGLQTDALECVALVLADHLERYHDPGLVAALDAFRDVPYGARLLAGQVAEAREKRARERRYVALVGQLAQLIRESPEDADRLFNFAKERSAREKLERKERDEVDFIRGRTDEIPF